MKVKMMEEMKMMMMMSGMTDEVLPEDFLLALCSRSQEVGMFPGLSTEMAARHMEQ